MVNGAKKEQGLNNMFKNKLAEFVYLRTYARYLPESGRRENWQETTRRVDEFLINRVKEISADGGVPTAVFDALNHVYTMDVMPSMRLMQFAGEAAKDNNILLYNCSFVRVDSIMRISEILYILMCGTGVGFSVEAEAIEKLPQIKKRNDQPILKHIIEDTRFGWKAAVYVGLSSWYEGYDIEFDYSQIRPAGTRLKTTGGYASGPEPLKQVLQFARQIILQRQGKRLKPIHVHDIICKIGECVVAGGVRRSALISLSDLDDGDLRDAKRGSFYTTHPYRSMANNSAVYTKKPSDLEFMAEWLSIATSGTGERGIFNRSQDYIAKSIPERRYRHLVEDGLIDEIGTNPCGEILLQPQQFCNLTEVVVRPEDDERTLVRKVMYATIIGTIQSSFTKFPGLQNEWRINCEAERLLGVSLTGIYDNALLSEANWVEGQIEMDDEGFTKLLMRRRRILRKLKKAARRINRVYANYFNINPSTSVTCIKPSGTVSQMVSSSSGIHPRYANFYIRRVRVGVHDPIFACLKAQGAIWHPEVGQTVDDMTTAVIEFAVKSPKDCITRHNLTAWHHFSDAIEFKECYTEHNVSVTIQVDKDEWFDLGLSVLEHMDTLGGMSFLPKHDHVYQLAPYEEITEEEYERRIAIEASIDFSKLGDYETSDKTDLISERACFGGQCEL